MKVKRGGIATSNLSRFCPAELFCMGFSFAAFFSFVLITRTTDLDYDSERRSIRRGDSRPF